MIIFLYYSLLFSSKEPAPLGVYLWNAQ